MNKYLPGQRWLWKPKSGWCEGYYEIIEFIEKVKFKIVLSTYQGSLYKKRRYL